MKISKSQLVILKSVRVLLLLISITSFGLGTFFLWARYLNPSRLNFDSAPPPAPRTQIRVLSGITPVRLLIPSLKIDLPVTESDIVDGVWNVSSSGISHLSESVSPGLPGNSIFYGHNWRSLLGSLHSIKVNDEIFVKNNEGLSLMFRVARISEVDPTDITILEPTVDPTLTLYTCSGFMDTKRLVVTAGLTH